MAAVTWSAKKSSALPAPVVIVGMFTGSGATTVANTNLASVVGKSYKAVLARVKFTGELEKTIVLDGGKSAVVVLGLGDPKKLTFESLRRAKCRCSSCRCLLSNCSCRIWKCSRIRAFGYRRSSRYV